jgi:hypothetical protein
MTMEEINKKCSGHRLRLPPPPQKWFESDLNHRKQHCQPPESQSPFKNQPIKSQQQHNIDGGTNTTINMKRAQNPLTLTLTARHLYRHCLCWREGGFIRQEPSIHWGLLSTWLRYCRRRIFDGNESGGLPWASHGLCWSSSPIEASQKNVP